MKQPLAIINQQGTNQSKRLEEGLINYKPCPISVVKARDSFTNPPQLCFIEYSGDMGNFKKQALDMRVKFPQTNVLSTYFNQPSVEEIGEINNLTDGQLFCTDDLYNQLDKFRKNGSLHKNLKIGLIGLGIFGQEIAKELSREKWLDELHIFSKSCTRGVRSYRDIMRNLGLFSMLKQKLTPHKSLESFAQASIDTDYIIFADGHFRQDYSRTNRVNNPEKELRNLYIKTVPLLDNVSNALKMAGYKNGLIIGSNPIGPLLLRAKRNFKDDGPNFYGSPTPDLFRIKLILSHWLNRIHKIKKDSCLETSSHPLNRLYVAGEHHDPCYNLEQCNLGELGLMEVLANNKLNQEYFKNTFHCALKAWGLQTMKQVQKLKTGISDSPKAIVNALKSVAYSIPDECLSNYVYLPQHDVFLQVPLKSNYLESPANTEILNSMPLEVQEKFNYQINKQNQYIKNGR